MSDNHIIDESLNYLADFVSSSSAMAGVIKMYAGTTAPLGWLICDGSAVSRTVYAKLFHAIGTTYGAGDGSTTFNLPDLRGRTPVGVGTGTATGATAHTLGEKAGAETHTLTQAQLPEVTSSFDIRAWSSAGGNPILVGSHYTSGNGASMAKIESISTNAVSQKVTHSFGSGQSHNNMQPYLAVNYIISTGMDIDLAPYSLDTATSFELQEKTVTGSSIAASSTGQIIVSAPENAVSLVGYYVTATTGSSSLTNIYAARYLTNNKKAQFMVRNNGTSALVPRITAQFLCVTNTQPVFVDNTYSDKVDNLINQDKIKGAVQEFPYSVSVSANSEKVIKTLSLPAGLWLIISHMGLSTGSGTSVYNHTLGGRTVRASEVNGGGSMNLVIRQHTETTNVELKAYSHVACTVGGSIYVINLGNALFEKMSS